MPYLYYREIGVAAEAARDHDKFGSNKYIIIAIAVAAGAGVVIGVAGSFLYYRVHRRSYDFTDMHDDVHILKSEVKRLQEIVDSQRDELDVCSKNHVKRKERKSSDSKRSVDKSGKSSNASGRSRDSSNESERSRDSAASPASSAAKTLAEKSIKKKDLKEKSLKKGENSLKKSASPEKLDSPEKVSPENGSPEKVPSPEKNSSLKSKSHDKNNAKEVTSSLSNQKDERKSKSKSEKKSADRGSIRLEDLYKAVDQLADSDSDEKRLVVYNLMTQNYQKNKNNPDFLWRYAAAVFLYAQTLANKDDNKRRELLFEAKKHAFTALELKDNDPDVHKWCAITLGILGTFAGMKEKIECAYRFKSHIDTALQISPNDAILHYLCGRWCYGVASLSWLERKMASTLAATPPTSSFDEALSHFLEADRLKPNWLENMLYLAKTYYAKKDYDSCRECIERTENIKPMTTDDFASKKELQELLEKL